MIACLGHVCLLMLLTHFPMLYLLLRELAERSLEYDVQCYTSVTFSVCVNVGLELNTYKIFGFSFA